MTRKISSSLNDAKGECKSFSAELPIIKAESENNFILALVSKQKSWVWLGMEKNEGKMVWLDGTPAEPSHGALYSAWKMNEPSKKEKEHCAYLDLNDGGWNDFECPAPGPYVLCQRVRKKDGSSKIEG